MLEMRDTRHLDFGRDRDLLLNVFRGMPRPLRDDVDVVVRDIGIGFDWKVVERNDAPREKQNRPAKNEKAIVQRKVDDPPNHCASSVASNWRTFETTCWPGEMPERISCLFPGSMGPA